MSGYREGVCNFCDGAPEERCPRCQAAVCATHGVAGREWCSVCMKELKDDLDVAGFGVDVNAVPGDFSRDTTRWSSYVDRSAGLDVGSIVSVLRAMIGSIFGGVKKARARRVFRARSAAEIAEWRRTAGVWSRT